MRTPAPAPVRRLSAVLFASAALAACAPQASAPVVPLAGHWTVTAEDVVLDTCDLVGTFGETGMPAGLSLDAAAQDGFTVVYDDDTEVLACSLDSTGLFSCDAYEESDSGSQSGGSYTLTYTWGTAGTLTTESSMTLDASMHLACDGNMCGEIGDSYGLDFPCELDVSRELAAD